MKVFKIYAKYHGNYQPFLEEPMLSQPFLILILVQLCAAGCLDWLCCWKGNDDDGSCKNVREAKRTAAACVAVCVRSGFCKRHYGYFKEPLPECPMHWKVSCKTRAKKSV
ncbi:unnamed protein product [Cylicocyclus nassatus]|uniref:Uncharacterized protein n=1 Tax=Cylicocyclus nassatus TaxID=53992 RepID=A0AA36DLB6_CYLNA|nr:unnamed protein product [Cylicocyclus nassatus]